MSASRGIAISAPGRPVLLAGFLVAVEFLVIGLTFKHGIDFDCHANWGIPACTAASRSLASLYCVIAAVFLFAFLRPQLIQTLLADAGRERRSLIVNGVGFVLAMLPAFFMREGAGTAVLLPAFGLWVPGMGLILLGILGWLAPRARWATFLKQAGLPLLVAVAAGAVAPSLAARLQPLWQLDWISDLTFGAVTWLIEGMGYDIFADPVRNHIGAEGFVISIAPVCSGVEGIALVSIFVTLYLWLFRAELRFPRAFLLYPFGIAASALLNVVRISVLLVIGMEGHPELAVGGFHSHAGWVMFTLVALGIIAIARRVPWLHKPAGASASATAHPLPPLRHDPVAARILPFAVFMLTAVIVPAISQNPSVFYPIRVLLLAGTVALVWPALRGIVWRVDPLAWLAGAAIGAMWVVIPIAPAEGPAPYGDLSGGLLVLWFAFRGIGTMLLVPLIEELFFRDYLEGRLRGADISQRVSPARDIVAIFVSAGLFAALHDRWVEAFVAGLVFSVVTRRRGHVSDAIAAHALANTIIFVVSVVSGKLLI